MLKLWRKGVVFFGFVIQSNIKLINHNIKNKYMNKNGFSTILVIAFILIVGGAVWYGYTQNAQRNIGTTQPMQSVVVASTTTPITSSTIAPTAPNSSGTSLTGTPPSCTFSGSPSIVIVPGTAKLIWVCQNVKACLITSNHGDRFSGQNSTGTLSVSPMPSSTTYTLKCDGLNGATSSNTVNILATIPSTT